MAKPERLHKIMAHAGVGSRRQCEQYILAGRVVVNGKPVTQLGTTVDPEEAEIRFDGRVLRSQRHVTFMVHKPPGALCTNDDELADPRGGRAARRRVIDLLPRMRERVYTIGRLDKDSEGLILVTNDGEFCNLLTHPRYEVPKSYHVVIKGRITPEILERIRTGVWLADSRSSRGARKTSPARVIVKKSFYNQAILEVTVYEGMNREIRRMFSQIGVDVDHLKRIRIGNLSLGSLPRGTARALTSDEIDALKRGAKSVP